MNERRYCGYCKKLLKNGDKCWLPRWGVFRVFGIIYCSKSCAKKDESLNYEIGEFYE